MERKTLDKSLIRKQNSKLAGAENQFSSLEKKLDSQETERLASSKKNTKPKNILPQASQSKNFINTSIASLLFSKILESFRSGREEKKTDAKEKPSYRIVEEEKSRAGGYGSVSKNYGSSPDNSYVDYAKLFSYLGDFKANSSHYSQNELLQARDANSKDNFFFGDMQSMEKAVRHFKYFSPSSNIDSISMVPISGMSSGEWEDFKLWMKIDPVMYRLKTSTS